MARRRTAITWGLGLLCFGALLIGAGALAFETVARGTKSSGQPQPSDAAIVALCTPMIAGCALCLAVITRVYVTVSDRYIEWTWGKAIVHLTRAEIEGIAIRQTGGHTEITVTFKRLTFFPRPRPPKARTITLGVHRRVDIPSLRNLASAILAARPRA